MNKYTTPQLVQDRKTGEWYNPAEKFAELLNSKFFQEIMVRLKNLWYNRYMNKYTPKQKALFATFCLRHEITFNTMGEYYSALDTYFIDWYNKGLIWIQF